MIRIDWRPLLTRDNLRRDAFAALTTTSVMVPQGVAFAAIAGLPPEYGFFSALLPPIVAAVFGSSWQMVSGPTAAISALVFSSLSGVFEPGSPQFISAAIVLAFMVGVFQLALGLARMGQLANLASTSVLVGFTTGAALLIVLGQLQFALGVPMPRPQDFRAFLSGLMAAVRGADLAAVAVTSTTLLFAVGIRLWRPRLPHYLVALAAGTLAGVLATRWGYPVDTVGSLRTVLPDFEIPALSVDTIRTLAQAALAVALVGLLEAVSIARAIAVDPEFLLLDEPTSALDPEMTAEVLDVIAELRTSEKPIILVTHEIGFARHTADLVALVADGGIPECSPATEFFDQPQHATTRRFLQRVLKY